LQGLARPLIQLARDGAQLCLGMNRQVSAAWKILAQLGALRESKGFR